MFRRRPAPDPEARRLARGLDAHRRSRRRLVLVSAIVTALVVGVPLVLATRMTPDNYGTVASFMGAVFLFPFTLLCFIQYAVLVVLIFYVAKGYNSLRKPLQGTLRTARRANLAMQGLSKRLARPVIELNARYTAVERFFGGGWLDKNADPSVEKDESQP